MGVLINIMVITNFCKIASASIVYHFGSVQIMLLNRRIPGLEVRTLICNSVGLYLKHPCKTMVIRSSLPETIYTYTIGFPCGWDQGVLSLSYKKFDELFQKKLVLWYCQSVIEYLFSQPIMLKFLKVHVSDLLLKSSRHCTTMVA